MAGPVGVRVIPTVTVLLPGTRISIAAHFQGSRPTVWRENLGARFPWVLASSSQWISPCTPRVVTLAYAWLLVATKKKLQVHASRSSNQMQPTKSYYIVSILERHGQQCTTIVCQLFLGHSVYMCIHNIRLYAQYTMQNGLFPVYFHWSLVKSFRSGTANCNFIMFVN